MSSRSSRAARSTSLGPGDGRFPPDEVLPKFTTSFQFVTSDDARKATRQKRSHVMREHRRRERWDRRSAKYQKKQREAASEHEQQRRAIEQQRKAAKYASRRHTVAPVKSQFRYAAIQPATLPVSRKLHLEL